MFYSYVHARPNTTNVSGIFYVGKGNYNRSSSVTRRNPYHRNIVNKYGKENILVGRIECSTEDIAFELEKGLIKCLKRMNVKLTNMTDGGDGVTGSQSKTDEWRKRHSEIMKGRPSPTKGIPKSSEHREKISKTLL